MMKIRYKQITKVTNFDTPTLINAILLALNKSGYVINKQTVNTVEFKYNLWSFGSQMDVFKNVDGGVFQIDNEHKGTLTLSYYLSPIFEIIAVLLATLFGIFKDYHFFIFVVFFTTMFVIRWLCVKRAAAKMVDHVIRL